MRIYRAAVTVLVVVCACRKDGPTIPNPKLSADVVRFAVEPPESQAELPAFELADARPNAKFLGHLPPKQADKLHDGEKDFEFHPNFAELADREPIESVRAPAVVKETLFKMRDAFSSADDLDFVGDEARVLHVARAERGATADKDTYPPEKPVLLYVSARRRVNKLRVDGPGSRFSVAVSSDGKIQGAVLYWKAKKSQVDKALPSLPAKDVREEIKAQLTRTQPHGTVVVTKIELAYYDANRRFLQPVYRYVADLTPASTVSKGRSSLFVGYVPLAKNEAMREEVPTDLTTDRAALPAVHYKDALPRHTDAPKQTGTNIAVGRYITHDEHTGWLRDSQAFWQQLESARTPHAFDPTQNFFSWRFMFTSRKDYFVNSVDLALIEAHGSPLTIMNYRDFGGDTRFNADVPLPGYGAEGGGRLKHLIVHSCRVIPAATDKYYGGDFKRWADAWWDLFNGLSSVVGYRSSMFIDDGAGAAMARNIARGEAVVPAWFGAVTSLNIYEQDSWAMTHCAKPDLLGRASAIAVCDKGTSATVADGSPARPSCLEAWWLGDQLIPVEPSSTPMAAVPDPSCPDEGDEEGPFPPGSR